MGGGFFWGGGLQAAMCVRVVLRVICKLSKPVVRMIAGLSIMKYSSHIANQSINHSTSQSID